MINDERLAEIRERCEDFCSMSLDAPGAQLRLHLVVAAGDRWELLTDHDELVGEVVVLHRALMLLAMERRGDPLESARRALNIARAELATKAEEQKED